MSSFTVKEFVESFNRSFDHMAEKSKKDRAIVAKKETIFDQNAGQQNNVSKLNIGSYTRSKELKNVDDSKTNMISRKQCLSQPKVLNSTEQSDLELCVRCLVCNDMIPMEYLNSHSVICQVQNRINHTNKVNFLPMHISFILF